MRYLVNENCIGCGLCVSLCPDFFEMSAQGTAQAIDADAAGNEGAEAMDNCPVGAIEEKE